MSRARKDLRIGSLLGTAWGKIHVYAAYTWFVAAGPLSHYIRGGPAQQAFTCVACVAAGPLSRHIGGGPAQQAFTCVACI